MHENQVYGKISKIAARIVGVMLSIAGLWVIFTKEISNEGTAFHAGLNAKGDVAVLFGVTLLAYGLYILYLSFRKNNK